MCDERLNGVTSNNTLCAQTPTNVRIISHTNMHQHIDARINVRASSNRIAEAISSRVILRIHDAVLRSNFHCTNICTLFKAQIIFLCIANAL